MTNKEIVISLFNSLSNIDCINRGGCLFAAYAVFLKAKELGIQGVNLVQVDTGWFEFVPRNIAFLKGEVDTPCIGNHYLLSIHGDLIDTRGVVDYSFSNKLKIRKHSDINRFSISSLKIWDQWNPEFNREEGVAQIKKILGIDLRYCL